MSDDGKKAEASTENIENTQSSVTSLSFEAAQSELESIVNRMERGEQELEQSLADFERGVALMNRCHHLLKDAEQKVDILVKDNSGLFSTEPFGDSSDTPEKIEEA